MAQRALVVNFIGNDADLRAAFKRIGTGMNTLQSAGKGMSSVGSSLTRGLTVPIVALATAAGKAAMDFQQSMETLRTQAGASQKQVDTLSGGVLKMSGQVGEAPNTLAAAMYHVVSALNATTAPAQRVSTELNVLRVAAEGARVGHADLTDVTNALDAAIVSGIKGVQNYQQAMGALNATVGAGDMTMQDLADALGTGLLAPMKTYGLTLQDVSGALAVFGDNNIRGETAATRLASAVRIMAAPSIAASKALATINVSTLELANDMRSGGLIKALEDLKTHLTDSGDTASQQALVITRAFGGRQSTGVQLLINQLDRLKAKTIEVGAGANDFAQDWATTQQTAAQKTADMISTIKADLVTFGDDVLPTLLSVADKVVKDVDDVAKAFQSLPKGLQSEIITGGLLLATVGPALKILGVFTSGIGTLVQLMRGNGLSVLAGGGSKVVRGVSSSAASAATSETVASTSILGSVRSGASTALSRGLAGATTAGIGVLLSQTIGDSIHNSVGSAIKSIGTDTSIGAGVGAFFGPEGAAGGAIIGGLIGTFSHFFSSENFGQKLAGDLTKGFGGSNAKALQSGLASTLNAMNKIASTAKVQTLGAGSPQHGLIPVQLDFSQLTGAQQQKYLALAFKAGGQLAGQLEKGWDQYKFQSEPVMFTQLKAEIAKMPPQVQAGAIESAVAFTRGLESQGRLAKGSTDELLDQVMREFPKAVQQIGGYGAQSAQAFAKAIDFNQAQQKLASELRQVENDFSGVQTAVVNVGGTIENKSAAAVLALEGIQKNGSAPMRAQATKDIQALRTEMESDFDAMTAKVSSAAASMTKQLQAGLPAATHAAGENFTQLVSNIHNAMASGVLTVSKGGQLITQALNTTLKAFGGRPLPTPASIALAQLSGLNVGSTGNDYQLHGARGMLMQIGRPGEAGRDSVPLNVGGIPVQVARGEQVAVFNRHQLPVVNDALAAKGYAGLPGLFSSIKKPNYMAEGGFVPGFASGGALSYSQLEGLWVQGGGPPSVEAIAAAIALAESGGRDVVQQGQPFAKTGWGPWQITPGGPQFLNLLTNAQEAVAKYKAAGNSFRPWTTFEDGAYKQFLGAGASAAVSAISQIAAPVVKGTGTITDLVSAGLQKATAAANAYLSAHVSPAGGSTGAAGIAGAGVGAFDPSQLGYFDGLQVAKWIIPELSWARARGWAGRVTSGWRSPTQVVHGEFATAPQGQSEHQYDVYPGGAVDVSDYSQFAQIIHGYPGADKLIQLPIDPLHFSGTGHARGGVIGPLPFAGSFDGGGTVPGPIGSPMLGVVHGGEVIHAASGTSITSKQAEAALAKAGSAADKALATGISNWLSTLAQIPSQGVGQQIKLAGISNQLTSAQNSGDTNGQQAALQAQIQLENQWLSRDKTKLQQVNKALAKKGLTRKQRASLLQDKLGLLQEIGTVSSDIGSAQSSLSDLTSGSSSDTGSSDTSGSDTSSTDTGPTQEQQDYTDAINAQTQAMQDLQASLDEQTQYMKSINAVETNQAIKALSDVISGQIGGLTLSRGSGSANAGQIVRY